MFDLTRLNDVRVQDDVIRQFINLRLNKLIEKGFTLGVDTKVMFIESIDDLYALNIFDDAGAYIAFFDCHVYYNCWEVSLENHSELIIPIELNVGHLFDEVFGDEYA